MRLIINISEDDYRKVQNGIASVSMMRKAITNGTLLPKGHGRLIDADAELEGLRKMKVVDEKDKQSVRFAIINYEQAPTIIEADKESEE